MPLAPEFSNRTFDVLQQRIDELDSQQFKLYQRVESYRQLSQISTLRQITAVKAQSLQQQVQHVAFGGLGTESREALIEQIGDLPPTSAGIANKPFPIKIGIISDLFLYKSFEGLADFHPIYPENFRDHRDLDILLLVSTWRGVDGVSWEGLASRTSDKRELLIEKVIPFFRALGIPIVFYSKEDPPNYAHFLSLAQQADHIFTSAEEMIPKYQQDCPNAESVDVLPFGINPRHHSPIGSQRGEINPIIPFAGSWFNHKYRHRSRWGGSILDAVMASNDYRLVIFDRNSDLRRPRYKFPNRYASALTPAIAHDLLLNIQRVVDIGINLNSVSNSASMFANRAIELQAQGTFVLSNYNVGLNSRYPHVHISNGFTDTLGALNSYGEGDIRKIQAAGIRSVFSNDLAIMRIAKILTTVGLTADVSEPRVAIIKHQDDSHLTKNIAHQTYANITALVDATDDLGTTKLKDRADVIVHMDTSHEYDPTHVEDLVNAFRYTDARTVEKIDPGTKETQAGHSYAPPQNVSTLGAEFVGEIPNGIRPEAGYRIDEIGVRQRARSIAVTTTQTREAKPPILSVIVPIYNNGSHLLYKCIASLRRSSIFDQMEIVLVDDGSTDIRTIHAIKTLEERLEHVQVYRFEPGGSGSASRPRNKGLELASCDYLTYLDPDNEALNDAYVKLLDTLLEYDVDFAVGNMTRWRGTNSSVGYTKFLRERLEMSDHIGCGGPQALVDMEFMPISIQALVAKTSWLRAIGISQPVGAVGQDSYFFQQMLYYAEKFAIVNLPVHTYYAQVENSVVNTVNAKFFEKYLPLERARSEWLGEVGLLEDYRNTRMETFFTGWYLRKLADVPVEQRPMAISTIAELGRMYGEHEWRSEEAKEFWAITINETAAETPIGDA
jgi:glycosyltransferase involved in cell wall biosynthesis